MISYLSPQFKYMIFYIYLISYILYSYVFSVFLFIYSLPTMGILQTHNVTIFQLA